MRRISALITSVALVLSGLALEASMASAASNWSSVATPSVNSQYMAASDDGRYVLVSGWTDLWVSTDGGVNWTSRKQDDAVVPGGWATVSVSSSGSVMFADKSYGTENKGLWKSTDYGTTWAKVTGLPNETYGTSISDDANTIFTNDIFTGRLWSSLDAGATWNLNALDTVFAYPYVSADGSTIVVSSNGELILSRDQGMNWTVIRTDNPTTDISAVGLSKNGSTIAFTENGPALSDSAMFISTNYGVNWSATSLPESNYFNTGYIAMSDDGAQILTSTVSNDYKDRKIYRSADSGQTWNLTLDMTASGGSDIQGIQSSPTGDLITLYFQDMAIYKGNFPDPAIAIEAARVAAAQAELASRTVSAKKKYAVKPLAARTGVTIISSKAKVSISIAKMSKRNCTKSGSSLKTLKAGNCVVTFTVQEPKPKGGKKPKATKTVKTLVVQ